MKKIYMFILGMFVLSLVGAGIISQFNLSNVVFEPKANATETIPEQITFDCGKETLVIDASEPDGKWDENDLQSAISNNCTEQVSNIKMNGLLYKKNKYGTKSFDETYLKEDECLKDGNYWYDNVCNNVPEEEEELN